MLTCYLGPGTAQCTLKCLLLRVLQFNRASPFLCQDNIMSQISLTGINGSESKAPWRPLHLKHCSILHYILGLHICNNYILSLFTPSSALRAGPWAWYSPPQYGRLLSHPRFQMPFVQWPGCTVAVLFAKHGVLLLEVILHNTPKTPSSQGQECSSGVMDGKVIITMIGASTVQNRRNRQSLQCLGLPFIKGNENLSCSLVFFGWN